MTFNNIKVPESVNNPPANNPAPNASWREAAAEILRNGRTMQLDPDDKRVFVYFLMLNTSADHPSGVPVGDPILTLGGEEASKTLNVVSDILPVTIIDGRIQPFTEAEIEKFLNSYKG